VLQYLVAALRVVGPHTSKTIRLQLQAHTELIALRLAHALAR
jgi:hypothetical protein